MMRLRLLMMMAFLAALALGAITPATAFADPLSSGCAHAQADAMPAMHHDHAPASPDRHNAPMDCCSGGICRMGSCASAALPLPVVQTACAGPSPAFFAPVATRLDGREVPPLEGPPRPILI